MKIQWSRVLAVSSCGVLAWPVLLDRRFALLQHQLNSASAYAASTLFPGANEPIPGNSPVQRCDVSRKGLLDLTRLDLDPNPPVKGQRLHIYAEGEVHNEPVVDGAYVDVDIYYGFLHLRQTFDICEEAGKAGIECPVEKGPLLVNTTADIPAQFASGRYMAEGRAYNADGKFITCLSGTIVLR